MTTRGIRRKKSYLVDAKIAVCGQKSVGKSGKLVNRLKCKRKQTIYDACSALNMRKYFCKMCSPWTIFSTRKKNLAETSENHFVKLKFKHEKFTRQNELHVWLLRWKREIYVE